MFFSNLHPHCVEDIPPFYVSCISALNTLKALDQNFEFSSHSPSCKALYSFLLEKGGVRPRVTSTFPFIDFKSVFINVHDSVIDPVALNIGFKLAHDVVPVAYTLYLRNITGNKYCSLCKVECETVEHLFYYCPFVLPARKLLSKWFNDIANLQLSLECIRFSVLPRTDSAKLFRKFLLFLLSEFRYVVWNMRNKARFDNKNITSNHILASFITRVKIRLYLDYIRLPVLHFEGQWCHTGFCSIDNNMQLVVHF